MTKILLNVLLNAVIISFLAYFLPGVSVDNFVTALLAALALSLIGAFIGPVVFLITLPLNLLTLGLFTFVLVALLVMLASYLVPGFTIDGFWPALLFGLVISLISLPFNTKVEEKT